MNPCNKRGLYKRNETSGNPHCQHNNRRLGYHCSSSLTWFYCSHHCTGGRYSPNHVNAAQGGPQERSFYLQNVHLQLARGTNLRYLIHIPLEINCWKIHAKDLGILIVPKSKFGSCAAFLHRFALIFFFLYLELRQNCIHSK